MNIFFLDDDPQKAARMLFDKHVNKMLLESAQMLFTAVRRHGYDGGGYKSAYENHPMTKWVGDSYWHGSWLLTHAVELAKEFELRYGHPHKTQDMLPALSMAVYQHLPDAEWRNPPRCIPDEYKIDYDSWSGDVPCHVQSYRDYYLGEKGYLYKYTNRSEPEWMGKVLEVVDE